MKKRDLHNLKGRDIPREFNYFGKVKAVWREARQRRKKV